MIAFSLMRDAKMLRLLVGKNPVLQIIALQKVWDRSAICEKICIFIWGAGPNSFGHTTPERPK